MGSTGYPAHLNPFGDDEDEEEKVPPTKVKQNNTDDYPDHLDPFGSDATTQVPPISNDDYDDSLNPFCDADEEGAINGNTVVRVESSQLPQVDDNNPFAEDIVRELKQQDAEIAKSQLITESQRNVPTPPTLDSLEPPKPLPRTKSLLKKEQAYKKRLQELQQAGTDSEHHTQSLQSTNSSIISSSSTTTTTTTDTSHSSTTVDSFQRRKNKRLAPPVPVNFKRQVSGSLSQIEEELNSIGDKLAIIDKESSICQTTLTASEEVNEADMRTTKSKFIELIRRRSSIVRRQKELMYQKRELKLDQLYSDIEYELRMIGNKQLSTRTQEDDTREKELLKKLVEIVEEKNDIVENLNKDTSCDTKDIEDAFRRLNIVEYKSMFPEKFRSGTAEKVSGTKICDKSGLNKFAKIATLLPKSNTIKIKRKHLFKKNCDSRPIEG